MQRTTNDKLRCPTCKGQGWTTNVMLGCPVCFGHGEVTPAWWLVVKSRQDTARRAVTCAS